jgi:hypothetical protein
VGCGIHNALLVQVPVVGVQQVGMVLQEGLAHAGVAQQERAESLGEDVLRTDIEPDLVCPALVVVPPRRHAPASPAAVASFRNSFSGIIRRSM